MNRVVLAGQLLRHFGPGWLAYRAWYALQMRTGRLRRKTSSFEWAVRHWQHSSAIRRVTLVTGTAQPRRFFQARSANGLSRSLCGMGSSQRSNPRRIG